MQDLASVMDRTGDPNLARSRSQRLRFRRSVCEETMSKHISFEALVRSCQSFSCTVHFRSTMQGTKLPFAGVTHQSRGDILPKTPASSDVRGHVTGPGGLVPLNQPYIYQLYQQLPHELLGGSIDPTTFPIASMLSDCSSCAM